MSIDNYVNGMSEGSQQRDSVKDKVYKRPVSVLVVIYAQDTKRVLMLQRRDDPEFWQSVTGSVEEGETASQAAMREVKEEVAIDVAAEQLTLIDCQRTVEFEIFSFTSSLCTGCAAQYRILVLPCAAARASDRF